jgi:ABC-type nitrate/sulfonate/bicarbonate transport system substrate-binding protein
MAYNRRVILKGGAAIALAAPFLSGTRARAQKQSIKIGSVLAGTTMAAELLPKYLKDAGIDAEVLQFPNLTQRMQALAAGSIQVGYGGINAAISIAGRGVPISVLSNACAGGWSLVGDPSIKDVKGLNGKKVGVQPGNICHIILSWKLAQEGLTDQVELVFMNNNDMPIPMQQRQIDAMFAVEPYPSLAKANGWAADIWDGYDTPIGKVNLGFMGATDFVKDNQELLTEILKAHALATEELQSKPAIAAEVTAKVLNMPRDVIDLSLTNTFFTTDSGDEFSSNIKSLGDIMLESKTADKLPDWSAFIDTSLIAKI